MKVKIYFKQLKEGWLLGMGCLLIIEHIDICLFLKFFNEKPQILAVLSVRFEVGVSLLPAPAGADKRGPLFL